MAVEVNHEVQLGADWAIPFTSADALAGGEVSFILSQDDAVLLTLSSEDSPSAVTVDSPDVTGSVAVSPLDQVDLVPGVYVYEIRGVLADDTTVVLQLGRILVLASLFAWPPFT